MFSHVDSAVVVSMMNFGRQIVSAILLIMGFTISANAETLPRGVLIISETAAESPFAHRFVEQIHLALDARTVQPYQIYTEYLDFGHFAGPSYDATLHTYFREKYRDEPIRVIVALGTQALQFVSHLRSEIWQNTSVLFVTFDHLLENGFKLPSNTTGIIATAPVSGPGNFRKTLRSKTWHYCSGRRATGPSATARRISKGCAAIC